MAEPKTHLMHYRDGERMALCGRMAYGSWFGKPGAVGRAAILGAVRTLPGGSPQNGRRGWLHARGARGEACC